MVETRGSDPLVKRKSAAMETRCSRGYVRKAYTRKDGTRVKAARSHSNTRKCAPSSRLIEIRRPGLLGDYGYSAKLPLQERRKALRTALEENDAISIFRRLMAISTLQKRTSPEMSEIFKEDAKYVKRNFMKKHN